MVTVDYRRFTLEEALAGKAAGWHFAAGWFRRMGVVVWAWFWKEVDG